MTTETISETQEPRDINALLALDTYQGMTDAEIDMVLQYRIDRAVTSREVLAKMEAENARMEQCIADNRASAKRALDMVQSLVEREFPTVPVGEPLTVSPRSIGA